MNYDLLVKKVGEIIEDVGLPIKNPCIGRTMAYYFTENNVHRFEISWSAGEVKKKQKIWFDHLKYELKNPVSVDDFNKFIRICCDLIELLRVRENDKDNFTMRPESWKLSNGTEYSCTCIFEMTLVED